MSNISTTLSKSIRIFTKNARVLAYQIQHPDSKRLVAYAIVLFVVIVLTGICCLAAHREFFVNPDVSSNDVCNFYLGTGVMDARGSHSSILSNGSCKHYLWKKPVMFKDTAIMKDPYSLQFQQSTGTKSLGGMIDELEQKMIAKNDQALQQFQTMNSHLSKA